MLKNGGFHLLIRSQKFDFRIIICFTSKYLLLLLSYVRCGGGGWGECSVVLGALSSLAIVLLRTIELIALLYLGCGCLCSVSSSFPRGNVGRSAVCDCAFPSPFSQSLDH